jgi:hypothetical protein
MLQSAQEARKLKGLFQKSVGVAYFHGISGMRGNDNRDVGIFVLAFNFFVQQLPIEIAGLDIEEDQIGLDFIQDSETFRIGIRQ